MKIAWRRGSILRCMVLVLQHTKFLYRHRLSNFSSYCVAPQKQLDVGNYAFALLFAVRLVLQKILWIKEHIKIEQSLACLLKNICDLIFCYLITIKRRLIYASGTI